MQEGPIASSSTWSDTCAPHNGVHALDDFLPEELPSRASLDQLYDYQPGQRQVPQVRHSLPSPALTFFALKLTPALHSKHHLHCCFADVGVVWYGAVGVSPVASLLPGSARGTGSGMEGQLGPQTLLPGPRHLLPAEDQQP